MVQPAIYICTQTYFKLVAAILSFVIRLKNLFFLSLSLPALPTLDIKPLTPQLSRFRWAEIYPALTDTWRTNGIRP